MTPELIKQVLEDNGAIYNDHENLACHAESQEEADAMGEIITVWFEKSGTNHCVDVLDGDELADKVSATI